MTYDREFELQSRLNHFINSRLGLPQADYYARLNQADFAELKSVLSDINNIFTMKTTLAFVEWLSDQLGYDEHIRRSMINGILETKPNANGYDVELTTPIPVIAEVKCNIPINRGVVYGSAQKDGITKDVLSLAEGKNKSQIDAKSCMKFLVLLDTPEVQEATAHFIKNMKIYHERMEIVDQHTSLNSLDKIYVKFIGF